MNFKNFFLLKTLIKYNISKSKITNLNYIRYNYNFFLRPVSAYLLICSYYFISLNQVSILDRVKLNNNTLIDVISLSYFDKLIFNFIF